MMANPYHRKSTCNTWVAWRYHDWIPQGVALANLSDMAGLSLHYGAWAAGARYPEPDIAAQRSAARVQGILEKLREDRHLIDASLAHWGRMRDDIDKAVLADERPDAHCCPLCRKYNTLYRKSPCVGCPIYERTGLRGCKGTPFDVARVYFNHCTTKRELRGDHAGWQQRLWERAATRMISYLKGTRAHVIRKAEEAAADYVQKTT
jgi:hypothetical protein